MSDIQCIFNLAARETSYTSHFPCCSSFVILLDHTFCTFLKSSDVIQRVRHNTIAKAAIYFFSIYGEYPVCIFIENNRITGEFPNFFPSFGVNNGTESIVGTCAISDKNRLAVSRCTRLEGWGRKENRIHIDRIDTFTENIYLMCLFHRYPALHSW